VIEAFADQLAGRQEDARRIGRQRIQVATSAAAASSTFGRADER
jgi:hypothetical protein